jgi:hypothetical protein
MSYAILLGVEELVDFCGSLPAAIEMIKERITRRKSEGKTTHLSEQQLAYMNELLETSGGTFYTPKQQGRNENYKASGGHND